MRDITTETFEAVLFDNDGTLTDSRGPVERSWRSWAAEHDVPFERFGNFHGVTSRGIVERVAPHLDADAATADIDRRELEDVEGIVALPGAVEALAAVGDRGAIVTSAGRELAEVRIRAAGLATTAVVVTADDISSGKPDPEPFLTGARLLGADPARCLVVEDATAGLEAGRAAGAATLALRTTTREEALAPGADLVVTSLADVRFERVDGGVRVHLRNG
ncbi:Putative phosphatase YfbT [Serinicoccus hydrothermalis]|uniref:Phosphatase YfbT n=1 Tax=Serinicoccus hydrothermalis TaxID=1758689 RepID=A0A1B1NGM8_9MICO|nr:HAD-IA family hydrolase [Serinicoccus hydrothermalis]ANS80570.1 Putative phosphatase YfbT [Serinicoccus hydrothermalis]